MTDYYKYVHNNDIENLHKPSEVHQVKGFSHVVLRLDVYLLLQLWMMEGVTNDLTEFQTSFLLLVYLKQIQPKKKVDVSISLHELRTWSIICMHICFNYWNTFQQLQFYFPLLYCLCLNTTVMVILHRVLEIYL